MTLSTWLRDYLFYPLGGSRGSSARTYFNLWLTMFLVGMWHGASFNFVVYGNLQAGAMLYNRFVRTRQRAAGIAPLLAVCALVGVFAGLMLHLALGIAPAASFAVGVASAVLALVNAWLPDGAKSPAWAAVHVLLMFHFTTLSRLFFRADNLQVAGQMASKLLAWDGLGVRDGLFRMHSLHEWLVGTPALGVLQSPLLWAAQRGVLLLVICGIAQHWAPARWTDGSLGPLFRRLPAAAIGLVLASVCLLLSQLLAGPRPNIYFSF
jgi:hypothetical protein